MIRNALLLVCCLLTFANQSFAQRNPPNAKSPLGINLSGVVDYATEMPFVDVFKPSRPWISQQQGKPWGQGPKLELTPEGWVKRLQPGQYATTLMCVAGGHPAGTYVCLYEGSGELEFSGNAKVRKQTPGRIELDVSKKEMLMLHLRKTDPNNPVRNIRVIMPGFEKTYQENPFYPPFLDRYRPFAVIRFMDWMRTNNSKIQSWEDRPKLTDATQARSGVALEHMIDLCNRLHIQPWFCMPHLADDDYIRNFARMVKDKLDPQLKIYVEHSNEVWNGQFAQAKYARERGRQLGLSDNDYQAQLFYHTKRSLEIFQIWQEVFGGTDRLVRVLGSQSANPWVSDQVMTYQDAYKKADALAIAPYFGNSLGNPKTADQVAQMSLDEVFARCREEIQRNHERIEMVVAKANKFGLDVITYEGGQHLVGHGGAENNEALTALFHRANRHPEMKKLYLEDLQSWKKAGGKLFTVFSSVSRPSKWGSWGLLEYEGQDPASAPKYQAIVEFLANSQRWWQD